MIKKFNTKYYGKKKYFYQRYKVEYYNIPCISICRYFFKFNNLLFKKLDILETKINKVLFYKLPSKRVRQYK